MNAHSLNNLNILQYLYTLMEYFYLLKAYLLLVLQITLHYIAF